MSGTTAATRNLLIYSLISFITKRGYCQTPPHIIYIIVDDLGWNDVGWHNPNNDEVVTPNLNKLVNNGIQLEAHYVYKTCTPSRSSIYSGRFPVHVNQALQDPDNDQAGIPRNMTGIGLKMKQGGYQTAIVGKWDVGMATPVHTPLGRGFDESLIYFEHKNDFWSFGLMQSGCLDETNATYTHLIDLWDTDAPADLEALGASNGDYHEEYLFRDRLLNVVNNYNGYSAKDTANDDDDLFQPLFLVYTPHVAHCPLQVPKEYLDKFIGFMKDTDESLCYTQSQQGFTPMTSEVYPGFGNDQDDYSCRAQYSSMINLLDDNIGELMNAIQSKQIVNKKAVQGDAGGGSGDESDTMYDNTLIVFTSDNGGCILLTESAGSNYPLRGGKYSDFEGGIKSAAFVSGGYLPLKVRGTISHTIMHVADWYTTFSILANVDPYDYQAELANEQVTAYQLPPVDGLNLIPIINGINLTSPHVYIPISNDAILYVPEKLKLIINNQNPSGYSAFMYPNSTSMNQDPSTAYNCSGPNGGCLFNVSSDASELNDLSFELSDMKDTMLNKLNELKLNFFSNSDINTDSCPPNIDLGTTPCACWMGANKYNGFFGPYQEIEV